MVSGCNLFAETVRTVCMSTMVVDGRMAMQTTMMPVTKPSRIRVAMDVMIVRTFFYDAVIWAKLIVCRFSCLLFFITISLCLDGDTNLRVYYP